MNDTANDAANDMHDMRGMPVAALYFDGKSSRRHHVTLTVLGQTAVLTGDIARRCPLSDLRVSERFSRASRKITFPDGAYLEIAHTPNFNALLDATHHRESPIVRAQQNWRAALAALAAIVALLAAAYLYLLPTASKVIANRLPASVERRIGAGTLAFLDRRFLQPSQLPPARQDALVARFTHLTPPRGTVPAYKILFRKSAIGPNALALPSGEIILTDELVTLLDDDDAVMGVLAHELGHLHEHHMMRQVIQGSVVGVAAAVLFGDVSIAVANLSALALTMRYSREAEREADDYAIAMFKANGIPLSKLAHVFEKLGEKLGNKAAEPTSGPIPYISSHPAGSERIAHIRQSE